MPWSFFSGYFHLYDLLEITVVLTIKFNISDINGSINFFRKDMFCQKTQ